jgi:hypothetical protein
MLKLDFRMQTLIRVGCCARMRRGIPCRTFRGWHATRRVASIGQREVQIQADGRRAAWRAETMQIVCDFRPPTISVATRTLTSGARRNGRRARDAGRSSVHVAAQTRTDAACRLDGRPCAELAGRGSGGHRSHRPMKAGGGGGAGQATAQGDKQRRK